MAELVLDVDVLEIMRSSVRELLTGRGRDLSDRIEVIHALALLAAAAEQGFVSVIGEIPEAGRDWSAIGEAIGLSASEAWTQLG